MRTSSPALHPPARPATVRPPATAGRGAQRRSLRAAAVAALLLVPVAAVAQPSPAGLWHTISDVDGRPRGIIRLQVTDGELTGTVVGSLVPGEPRGKRCSSCTGARKDQPLEGMVILSGLRWDGEKWTGGEIVDPDSGKTYRATIRVAEDGRSLALRGYLGVSLLGRTQRWVRAP